MKKSLFPQAFSWAQDSHRDCSPLRFIHSYPAKYFFFLSIPNVKNIMLALSPSMNLKYTSNAIL